MIYQRLRPGFLDDVKVGINALDVNLFSLRSFRPIILYIFILERTEQS